MDSDHNTNILKQSPLDRRASAPVVPTQPGMKHWVPSRYNIRMNSPDGRLVIWNTLRGSMSVFKADQSAEIVGLLGQKGFQAPEQDLVKYLVDRGILLEKGSNEYRQFQMLFGREQYRADVLQLILLASEDCNFRCRYCYEKFEHGTMHPAVRTGIKKMLEKRLPQLSNLHIQWFGGEPLYGLTAIEDIAPWVAEMAEKHDVRYGSSMTTNGYLLTPEVADKLLAWKVNNFQITIDGPAENHNQSRPSREGGETFQTIFNNLKAMSQRKEDFSILLRVNFDPTNHQNVPRLMDQLKQELGTDSRFRFHFHPVGKWGGSNDENLEVCGASSFETTAMLKAAAHERGFNVETLRGMNLPGSQVCYAARPYNLIIGATGKVMKCTVVLDTDERNVVGNILPTGQLNLDSDKMGLWTEPAFESDSQCQKCIMLPQCQGISCPLARMRTNEPPCIPTRRYAKRQMQETLDYGNKGKVRQIPAMTR
jgi:uncharacterized protein